MNNYFREKYFLRNIAVWLFKLKQFDKSIEVLDMIIHVYECREAMCNKVIVLCCQEKFKEAIQLIDDSLSTNSSDTVLYLKAWALKGLNEYTLAIQMFNKIIEHTSNSLIQKAHCLTMLEMYDDACKLYDHAIDLDPSDTDTVVDALCFKGYVCVLQSKYSNALLFYDMAINIDPGNASIFNYKGLCLFASQEYVKALCCFDKSLQLFQQQDISDLSVICHHKAKTLSCLGRFNDAIEFYDKSLLCLPSVEKYIDKAFAMQSLKRSREAIECFEKSLLMNPRSTIALYNKGLEHALLREYGEAIKCYDTAIEITPLDPILLSAKATTLMSICMFEDAVVLFDTCSGIDPLSVYHIFNKGNSLAHLKKYVEAIVCFDTVI